MHLPQISERFRKVPKTSELKSPEQPANHQQENQNLPPDQVQELEKLRVEKKVWERERQFYDAWFAALEKERGSFVPQLVEQSKSLGYLEAKVENLEKENKRLLPTPRESTPRTEQPSYTDDAYHEEISEG